MSAAAAWDFAVGLYGRPGVGDACLALQDRRGADVIVLLALIHRATHAAAVDEDRLRAALSRIAPWREAAILPLRSLRRSLKGWRFAEDAVDGEAESARQSIAAAERAAERAALSAFLRGLGDAPPEQGDDRLAAAAQALSAYWRSAGLAHDQADRDALAAILARAFPEQAVAAPRAVAAAFNP